jgi:hypothetical protein
METLEQELLLRTFQHRYTILGAQLAEDYMKQQTTGSIKIPTFIAEQQKMQYVSDTIQKYMEKGTFNEEYEKAWENIKERIPDNYSTLL